MSRNGTKETIMLFLFISKSRKQYLRYMTSANLRKITDVGKNGQGCTYEQTIWLPRAQKKKKKMGDDGFFLATGHLGPL